MALIDADALEYLPLIASCGNGKYNTVKVLYERDIENAPTVDIVRCCECKYLKQNRVTGSHWCDRRADKVIVIPDDYCSFGERDEK